MSTDDVGRLEDFSDDEDTTVEQLPFEQLQECKVEKVVGKSKRRV